MYLANKNDSNPEFVLLHHPPPRIRDEKKKPLQRFIFKFLSQRSDLDAHYVLLCLRSSVLKHPTDENYPGRMFSRGVIIDAKTDMSG